MSLPLALLVTSTVGWLYMVRVAIDDPGFAVERDYYKKASNFEETIAQRQRNAALGFRVSVVSFAPDHGRVEVKLKAVDNHGTPLTDVLVRIEAFPNARAFDIQTATLNHEGTGIFSTELLRPRKGIWELRVNLVGKESFTIVLRPELRESALDEVGPPS